MKKAIVLATILIASLSLASGEELDGKALLIKGKNELDGGRYAEAIESLSEAYKRVEVLGDYILFWISRAHRELGNFNDSNSLIKEMLMNYPDSPLNKKARSMEISNIIAIDDSPDDLQVFESYVKDYPEDYEIKFLYAQLLKGQGNSDRAKAIFKDLYINSGDVISKIAYNELTVSDIAVPDLIEKGTNLLDLTEYKEAEFILRVALLKDNGQYKNEILKKLGDSLFRQRRYKESAEIYEKVGEYYSKAKALYRAGEKDALDSTLKKLSQIKDKRTGSLLIMVASDKRREGDIDEAISLYKNIKTNYPSEAENAMWGIGWIYYRSGDYQRALDIFSELCNTYGSSRYLYWKARSLERLGKDAEFIYRELAGKEQDFYSVLSYIKTQQNSIGTTLSKDNSSQYRDLYQERGQIEVGNENSQRRLTSRGHNTEIKNSTPMVYNSALTTNSDLKHTIQSERIDILLELGMKKEAVTELSALARKATDFNMLLYICSKLHEAGEYRLVLLLAARFPNNTIMRDMLYPLAHWPTVKEISVKHGLDPFIILSIMREESHFDPEARSSAGALGLMQLMPQTAYLIDRKINLNITSREKIHDIETNITLGSYHINSLLKEFDSFPAAIAAYNAGGDTVRKWQRSGNYKSIDEFIEDIPYEETKNYTKKVITTYFEYLRSTGKKELPKIL